MIEQAWQVRQARPEDAPALKQLWRASFAEDAEGPFADWYFANIFQPQSCWVMAGLSGEIGAMCHAPLREMQLPEGSRLAVPYIQGVATAEARRGQGLCHRLLAAAEAELARRGHALCLLKPFDPAFYQPLGYRFATYLRRYEVDFNKHYLNRLPAWEPDFQRHYYLPECMPAAAPAAAQVYRQWCGQPGGPASFACRPAEHMARLLADHAQDGGQLILAQNAKNQPLAYALFNTTPEGIFVRELAFAQPEAGKKLLCALAADYREDTPAAVIMAPDNPACAAPLPKSLAGWQVLPFAMLKPLTKGPSECYNMVMGAHFYEYF